MNSPANFSPCSEPTSISGFAVGSIFLVLIFIAINAARIATVAANHGETPFLSANDRSRWCAIAALLEDQSFAIDRLLEKRDAKGKIRTWYSIDMVKHPDASGTEHFYSSKPPLLTLAYTAATWPTTIAFQKRLSEFPLLIGRVSLLLINLLPSLILVFWWRGILIKQVTNDWARWFLFTCGVFGTFLTTFLVTLNNHLHAAICVVLTIIFLQRILSERAHGNLASDKGASQSNLIYLGIAAGGCVMCDLPALAWAGLIPFIIFTRSKWLSDWTLYAVGLFPVLLAIVGANWYAHGDWRPPYYHREALGPLLIQIPSEQVIAPDNQSIDLDLHRLDSSQLLRLNAQLDTSELKETLGIKSPIRLEPARRKNTLRLIANDFANQAVEKRFAVVFDSVTWSIHRWNDWYDYPGSYWLSENKRGVDLGEPSKQVYAWNCLLGHHGIFSLTPFFIFSILGAIAASRGSQWDTRRLAIGIVIVSVVSLGFYLTRNQLDRNYGGVASGFRWQFWLIPAWLWLAAQLYRFESSIWIQNKFLRRVAELSCFVSIFSAWYPATNPWQHPWAYQLFLRIFE